MKTFTSVHRYILTTKGETEKIQVPKGKGELQKILKLTTETSWTEWLRSQFVKPWWEELWNDCLSSRQKVRSVGLQEVQERILPGEAHGTMKYSTTQPEKEEWGVVDHLARFMWNVIDLTQNSNEGVFYNRRFKVDYCEAIVWGLKSELMKMHSPSYINKGTGRTAIFGTTRPGKKHTSVPTM